ncbi:MAG: CYTH domain-containing protein [Patescibacteria group bacterium]|nr:CYTH domain-containing protein [Patescibacteria group bacterium]
MKTNQVEVEIKTLVGSKEAQESLIARMRKIYPKLTLKKKESQLNHYFTDGNYDKLYKNLTPYIPQVDQERFREIVLQGKNHSVRTRKTDSEVLFIIKASRDQTTSENGTARTEFEVPVELDINELDALLLRSGFQYQAKWSRERQEYQYKEYSVSIDKNAGYGYLAEFERLVPPDSDIEGVKREIRAEMSILSLVELPQERLARMFEYYNKHWPEYYGTEKTFVIE